MLAERKLRLPGGGVTLAVIGSSHFLEVVAGGMVMSEMLVSHDPALEGLPQPVKVGAVSGWRHERRRGNVAYQFELHTSSCSFGDLDRETARLAVSSRNRLSYVFPSRDGELGAVTSIEWQVEGSRITVETYHTFPGEPAIVRSRSVVDLLERGVLS